MRNLQLVLVLIALACVGVSGQIPIKPISGGVVNGKAISLPAPEYPAAAKAVGASGGVTVEVVIGENGDIISARAVSGHPLLRSASEKAALEAKFGQTLLSGNPVKVSGVIVYNFTLPVEPVASTGDEEFEFMGLIAALRIMSNVNSNPVLDPIADTFFEEFGKEIAGERPPEGLELYKELSTATKQRRTEILAQLDLAYRQDIDENQVWQYAVGEVLGNLMTESLRLAVVGKTDGPTFKINLTRLKGLMASAPRAFPEDLRAKFNEIAGFAEREDLEDPGVSKLLVEKIDVIGDLVL